jgi:hypothetical protein
MSFPHFFCTAVDAKMSFKFASATRHLNTGIQSHSTIYTLVFWSDGLAQKFDRGLKTFLRWDLKPVPI